MSSHNYLELQSWFVLDSAEESDGVGLMGASGAYLKLSRSAATLLQAVQAGQTFADIAQKINQQQGGAVTTEQVAYAYQHVLKQIEQLDTIVDTRHIGFLWRVPLIPAFVVHKIMPYFSFLFHPLVAAGFIGAFALAGVFLWQESAWLGHFHADGIGLLLLLLSGLFHELGHATACQRYGAEPKEIGFTLYWFFPALYSDVSAVWRLKRWQRLCVDVGGVYFQLIMGVFYLLVYRIVGWEPFLDAALLIVSMAFFALNPLFKFDGYWVLSDLLGVTNLSRQPKRLGAYFYDRWRGRASKPLPWPTWIVMVLIGYGVLSMGLWLYFMATIVPVLWDGVVHYPAHMILLLKIGVPWSLLVQRTTTMLFGVLVLVGMGKLLWRIMGCGRLAKTLFRGRDNV